MPTPVPAQDTPQPDAARDPALDGLRGFAILLVYLFHYGGGLRSANPAVRILGYFTQAGWTGVHIFFALSGFLITGLLWQDRDQPHTLRNFYGRRALRILPAYYGALCLSAIVAVFRGAHLAQLRPLLVYAAFLQNLPPLIPEALHYPRPLPLHHLWSLAVEEQFYLLWPFLLLAARTRHRALRLSLWTFAVCCVFRALVFLSLPGAAALDWSPFLLTRAGSLALGSALALTVRSPRTSRWALAAFATGTAIFIADSLASRSFLLLHSTQFVLALPGVDLACAGLVALALDPGVWRTLLSLAPLRWLGRISYAFYVLHVLLEPLFDLLGRWATHTTTGSAYQAVRLLAGFPITVLAATASWFLWERPFLRLKRFFPRRSAPALDPGTS